MLNKKTEINYRDNFIKHYSYDGYVSDLAVAIFNSDLAIRSVSVIEDVDMDMKVYSGNYSYSEFCERDELFFAADKLIFFPDKVNASIQIDMKENTVVLTTKDPALELQDLIPSC